MSTDNILTLVGFVVTLIGVFVSANETRSKVTNELDKKTALQQQEIDYIKNSIIEVKADVKEHNHYARLFSETMPVVQEQIKVANNRIDSLERKAS